MLKSACPRTPSRLGGGRNGQLFEDVPPASQAGRPGLGPPEPLERRCWGNSTSGVPGASSRRRSLQCANASPERASAAHVTERCSSALARLCSAGKEPAAGRRMVTHVWPPAAIPSPYPYSIVKEQCRSGFRLPVAGMRYALTVLRSSVRQSPSGSGIAGLSPSDSRSASRVTSGNQCL